MSKQDLYIIMVALHSLVKGYGIISQITFLPIFKNAIYMYLIGNHSFKYFELILLILINMFLLI